MNQLRQLIARLDDPKVVLKQLRLIVIVSICGIPFAVWIGSKYINDGMRGSWAQEDAAMMVVAFHLRHHRFPSNWDEAAPFYPQRYYGGSLLSPDETKSRVNIDFDRPPAAPDGSVLLDHKSRPIKYITLRNGKREWWKGSEPNTIVLSYLRGSDDPRVRAMKEQVQQP